MDPIKVFISYSHKDRTEKNHLVSHLKVLESEDVQTSIKVETWDDSEIGLGEEWENKIDEALKESQIAILIVTANFLTSDFIRKKEVKAILELHKKDLIVIPIIARACSWQRVSWLARLNIFNSGQVIWEAKLEHVDEDLAAIAREVADHAERLASTRQPLLQPQPSAAAQVETQPERQVHLLFISSRCEDDAGNIARGLSLMKRWFRSPFKPADLSSAEKDAYTVLDVARRVISDRGEEASRRLVCSGEGSGVVVAAFDDPRELLGFLVPAFLRLRESGARCLRMGLHSATVDHSDTNSAGIPFKEIDVARRIMELGHDGHVVCSAEAERLLRYQLNGALKLTIDLFPRRELTPGKRVDVFSIHDAKIGSARGPKSKSQETVLRVISLPKSVRALRETKFKIEFGLDIRYVKIQFKLENSPAKIRVSHGEREGEDGVFEFDFEQGISREQKFTLLPTENPPDDLFFVLKVRCFDESGDLIATQFEQPVRLYCKPPPPKDYKDFVGLAIWLWDIIRFSRWYAKPAVILIACLAVYLPLPRTSKESVKLFLFWPRPYKGAFEDNFKKPDDYLERWDILGATARPLIDGKGGDPRIDGALVVTNGQSALVSRTFLKSQSFYDFKLNFAFRYRPGSSKAGWILHSQADNRRGYLFVLERKGGGYFELSGTIDEGDGHPRPISGVAARSISFERDCQDNDIMSIRVTVSDCKFHYEIHIEPEDEPETPTQTADFEDEYQEFPYGNAGLKQPATDEIVVEFWRMAQVGYRTDPK